MACRPRQARQLLGFETRQGTVGLPYSLLDLLKVSQRQSKLVILQTIPRFEASTR